MTGNHSHLEVADAACSSTDALEESILRAPPTLDTICHLLERDLAGEAHSFTVGRHPGGLDGIPGVFIDFKLKSENPYRFQLRLDAVLRRLNSGKLTGYWPELDFERPFYGTRWRIRTVISDFGKWHR